MKLAATVCLVIAVLMALVMLAAVIQGPLPEPGMNESQWFGHILGGLFPTIIFFFAGLLLLQAAQKREADIVRAVPERPSKNPFA
jgi:hypothetical protein